MLRKTTVALAVVLMLGGGFITTDAFAAGEHAGGGHPAGVHPGGGHPGGGHPGGGHRGYVGGGATEVADMVARTVATSVRLTGLAAAFRCRCQLLVAGNPAARSR